MRSVVLLIIAFTVAGCGSAASNANSSVSAVPTASTGVDPPSAPSQPEPAAKAIPWSCADESQICVPDPEFVSRLCDGSFPDVALALLSKSAPFTRTYLTGDVDGWNADGGRSARTRLRFDEEVLALKRRAAPKNGIVMGAGGGYLVMRWDGNCYTLDEGEVTMRRPPAPKHAAIPWRYLSEGTKEALLQRERCWRPTSGAARNAKGR